MEILVFGKTGQLGLSLKDTAPPGQNIHYIGHDECDLAEPGAVTRCLEEHKPDYIVNAAAYTQVDKAEQEPNLAHQINAEAVREIAAWIAVISTEPPKASVAPVISTGPAAGREAEKSPKPKDLEPNSVISTELGAGQEAEKSPKLIHISTDFVFDGQSTTLYKPDDPTNPLGQYGKTKLAGEKAILDIAPDFTMIIRTAWVYSEHGQNFVKTMLRLMAEKEELGVVNDQRGSPTYARGLAEVIWQIVTEDRFSAGIYHWTDKGDVTWHEFASAIQEEALKLGLLDKTIPINAITTADYPTPAQRPAYSVLESSKLVELLAGDPQDWRDSLRFMVVKLSQRSF
ncbi:MAG: dTDP-4-dehydrorhamnose reductase [Gammaproteobacteria bacterium]|jgi:dTDP-4-dehydrorhamnose reductase|nr:dTDP-4-dehydrorhamnose reductase [Gammaproteobacteria bacterium]MBT7369229.1 dTDP-4-dehydrorhamnose reductase [Gammaproteobacteria bacterium]